MADTVFPGKHALGLIIPAAALAGGHKIQKKLLENS
jgi:hypothetical protein